MSPNPTPSRILLITPHGPTTNPSALIYDISKILPLSEWQATSTTLAQAKVFVAQHPSVPLHKYLLTRTTTSTGTQDLTFSTPTSTVATVSVPSDASLPFSVTLPTLENPVLIDSSTSPKEHKFTYRDVGYSWQLGMVDGVPAIKLRETGGEEEVVVATLRLGERFFGDGGLLVSGPGKEKGDETEEEEDREVVVLASVLGCWNREGRARVQDREA